MRLMCLREVYIDFDKAGFQNSKIVSLYCRGERKIQALRDQFEVVDCGHHCGPR